MNKVTAQAPKSRDAKRGSSVSDKQVAYAVRDQHPVQVRLMNGDFLVALAYVIGMDDYHWVLVDHDLSTHLVHKTVPCLTILSGLTLDQDRHPSAPAIRERTAVFREMIIRTHFNHQPAKEPVS